MELGGVYFEWWSLRAAQGVWPFVELAVGAAALYRSQARAVHALVLAVYGLLFLVALWLTYQGYPSCGCFGRLRVPPPAIATIDALVLAALVGTLARRIRQAFPPTAALLLGMVLAVWALQPPPAQLLALGQGVWKHLEAPVVHVDPDSWSGKSLPVRLVDDRPDGPALYVLVRDWCPRCVAWARRLGDRAEREGYPVRLLYVGRDRVTVQNEELALCPGQSPSAFLVGPGGRVRRVWHFSSPEPGRGRAPPRCPFRFPTGK